MRTWLRSVAIVVAAAVIAILTMKLRGLRAANEALVEHVAVYQQEKAYLCNQLRIQLVRRGLSVERRLKGAIFSQDWIEFCAAPENLAAARLVWSRHGILDEDRVVKALEEFRALIQYDDWGRGPAPKPYASP